VTAASYLLQVLLFSW